MTKKTGLGKGLDALLTNNVVEEEKEIFYDDEQDAVVIWKNCRIFANAKQLI